MVEKWVVIIIGTTLHDGNQSCAHNNCYQKLVTTTTRHGQYTDFRAPTTRQFVKKTNQKKRARTDMKITEVGHLLNWSPDNIILLLEH
jgi:hypothetical protein